MRKNRIPGSRSAVWRFFERRNISFKKSLYAAEQKRAENARARQRWTRQQGMFDPAQLVFIDESWTSTSMVRLRGRCPRGERLIGYAPQGHWKVITFVALPQAGVAMVAPFVLEGATGALSPLRARMQTFPQTRPHFVRVFFPMYTRTDNLLL